jgi:hypothetical protein
MRLDLEIEAAGSCWPLGQADYRTEVSNLLDYGRRCPRGRCLRLLALEVFRETSPLLNQRGMAGLMLIEFLGLALIFLGAHVTL